MSVSLVGLGIEAVSEHGSESDDSDDSDGGLNDLVARTSE
jgi:hypothetical protein